MDLTNTKKRNSHLVHRLQKTRSTSFDDDENLSNNSSSSFNAFFAAVSDTESQSPISVRDMIKRYDTVAKLSNKDGIRNSPLQQQQHQQQQQQQQYKHQQQPQHNLASMKSAYFGVNKFGTNTATQRFPIRQHINRMQEDRVGSKSMHTPRRKSFHNNSEHGNNNNKNKGNSKLSDNVFLMPKKKADAEDDSDMNMSRGRHASLSDSENIYIADHTRRTSRSPVRDLNGASSSLQALANTNLNASEGADSVEEANLQPMETSYQSKTTIAKTAGGVRIIIDIFFDQEHQPVSATDVVGSRVETDIPQSRILSEFQQQAAASAQLTQN